MKCKEAEVWLAKQLKTMYEEGEAQIVASLVMENITMKSRSERILSENELLNEQQLQRLNEINKRLQQHEPVQYILNKASFYGMKLFVDNNVLVPRPETEELVEWILQDVKAAGLDVFRRAQIQADETTILKVLDVGTGSGCIALALKKAMSKAEVWGCDISEEALNVARRNGSELDIRVDFQGINFLDESQQRLLPTVDIIVSNPPYVPQKDKQTMQPNVLNFEPHIALFVPDDDALIFYKAIARFSKHRLYDGGKIYVEIHENLGQDVIDLFESEGYENVEIKKDLQGKERMVKVQKIGS